MVRVLMAALCVVFFAAPLQAGGLDDLKAANAAVTANKGDDAIRLFTQALAASDLSPADRLAALKGRAGEYSAKAAIANTFRRYDEARSQRNNAIVDFTAAIGFKADDASLYISRAQAYHMSGDYDKAIADLDTALKLKTSSTVLAQRAAARLAKGDYDGAVADDTAALAAAGKEGGADGWELYNERAYAQFVAGRFSAAAADFDKALTLGLPSRAEDVLWLPYQAAWLHIARARAGEDDAAELARNAGKINLKQWPGTLVAFFLGQVKANEVSGSSSHGMMSHARECNVSFFTGQHALVKRDLAEGARLLQSARDVCNALSVQHLAAVAELKRLNK